MAKLQERRANLPPVNRHVRDFALLEVFRGGGRSYCAPFLAAAPPVATIGARAGSHAGSGRAYRNLRRVTLPSDLAPFPVTTLQTTPPTLPAVQRTRSFRRWQRRLRGRLEEGSEDAGTDSLTFCLLLLLVLFKPCVVLIDCEYVLAQLCLRIQQKHGLVQCSDASRGSHCVHQEAYPAFNRESFLREKLPNKRKPLR